MFNIIKPIADWFKSDIEVDNKLSEAKVVCNKDLQITVDKKEYSIVGDAIYTKSSKDVPQWMADLVDETVRVAWENSTDLNTFLTNLRDTLDQIEVNNNAYDSRITVVETSTGNLVQSYETLNSTVQGNQAEIINIQQTYATEDYAVTTAVDQIQASINDGAIGSEVTRIDTAIATERDTRSASITAIESQLEDPDTGLLATASATESLYTSVGYEYGTNTPTGIGMLQDVQILQKQNDGIIETTTGTYDVMIGVEDPNNVTDNDELDVTKEPYATWIAVDTANGDTAQRSMHVGDVYIKYSSVDTGYKTYERAYKFIKTLVDGTSPYSTDSEGFTWALITDTDAQNAYVVALNAYDLADGKVTTYYGTRAETTGEATGDLLIASDENDKMYRWDGSGWVDIQDKAIVANAGAITTLNTNLQSGDGTWANADSTLENTLNTKINEDTAAVESKFAYGSNLIINGVNYTSGFGLMSSLIDAGSGVPAGTSEFWINADKFRFSDANGKADTQVFTADSVANTVTFNGVVSFNSVTDKPTHTSGAGNPTGTAIAGSTYQNITDSSFWSYTGGTWIAGGDPNALTAEDLSSTGTTVIDGGRITTDTLQANRLKAGTNSTTVWTGGGLISSDFNGNAYGDIGSPTAGFRLSSSAAGTSDDPTIYGPYIKGGTIESVNLISLNVSADTIGVNSNNYPNNYGALSKTITSGNFVGQNASPSGYLSNRIANASSIIIVTGLCDFSYYEFDFTVNYSITAYLQYSLDSGSSWNTMKSYKKSFNLPSAEASLLSGDDSIILFEALSGSIVPSNGDIIFRVTTGGRANTSVKSTFYTATLYNQ